jgi:hypothetical protein
MKTIFPDLLVEAIHLNTSVIALYDAPANNTFESVVETKPGIRKCLFAFYEDWMAGKTLKLSAGNSGCGGCGHRLFDIATRDRQGFIKFLTDDEGLKASHELMNHWLDQNKPYKPVHDAIFIGPFNEDLYEFIRTITFFVNPDQLSVLMLAANYFAASGDITPVKAPFGSGCMEMLPLFDTFEAPQAILGSTDLAMREHLPANIMAFTVNKPMFENFGLISEDSFLTKPFLKRLKKARGREF